MRKRAQLSGEEKDSKVIVRYQTLGRAGKLGTNGMEEPSAHERRQEAGEEGQQFMDTEFGCRRLLRGRRRFGGGWCGSWVFRLKRRDGGSRGIGGAGFFEDGGVGVGGIGCFGIWQAARLR